MLHHCTSCRSEQLSTKKTSRLSNVCGYQFSVDNVPAIVCENCGLTYYTADVVKQLELTIATWLAENFVGTGAALRYMRKALGIKGKDLAALFDVAPETLSRWESGERSLDRKALFILGEMVLDVTKRGGKGRTIQCLSALHGSSPDPSIVISLNGVING